MTIEKQKVADKDAGRVAAVEWAKEIEAQFNSGDNRLRFMKVGVNPKYRRANIYVEYEDVTKSRPSGSEDTVAGLWEEFIEWPEADPSENNGASWRNLSYPKTQIKRAFLLAEELKTQLIILSYSDDLKCYIENGEVHIDRV